ncbi:ficolin-1-A-like isoform X1 [Physella acuta]|uniref:ficolin-1-A-like isoform X1 n=1 Tax=Physella acuta TaxID=109671 RepID=UPI0027DD9AA8|nr:ficolin-1-A-like isoform X1 [Physella acuta]
MSSRVKSSEVNQKRNMSKSIYLVLLLILNFTSGYCAEQKFGNLDKRVAELEEIMQVLEENFGLSKFKSSSSFTGRFVNWPTPYSEYTSLPKLVKCERNMDPDYPHLVLAVIEGGHVVMCDTKTDGGGWIIMQRRVVGDVNFHRGWHDYKHGFGSYNGDFWLGNELIHQLTAEGQFELRVDFVYDRYDYTAVYDSFRVESESSLYKLRLGQRTQGNNDQLTVHKDANFSTIDRDNSNWCAKNFLGGWWYFDNDSCMAVNPNGVWKLNSKQGLYWQGVTPENSVNRVEFKFRPKC